MGSNRFEPKTGREGGEHDECALDAARGLLAKAKAMGECQVAAGERWELRLGLETTHVPQGPYRVGESGFLTLSTVLVSDLVFQPKFIAKVF